MTSDRQRRPSAYNDPLRTALHDRAQEQLPTDLVDPIKLDATGRILFDETTGDFAVEIEVGGEDPALKTHVARAVAAALGRMFTDGSEAVAQLLAESQRDAAWAGRVASTLDSYRHVINDDVFAALRGTAVDVDREAEIRLRHAIARVYSARGEVALGLDEVERARPLVEPAEQRYLLALEHTQAVLLGAAGDDRCPDACRRAIQIARALGNHSFAGNAFRTWSLYHWRRREFAEAMRLFDEATERLQVVGGTPYLYHLLDTLERIAGLDRARTRRYVDSALAVLSNANAASSTVSARARLAIAQHLLASQPTPIECDLAVELIVRALATFRQLAGLEARAATCVALLALEHERRGNFGLAQTFAEDHDRWLAGVPEGEARLRGELGGMLRDRDLPSLLDQEHRVTVLGHRALYPLWAVAVAALLIAGDDCVPALDLLDEAERQAANRNHEDLANVHRARATAYRCLRDRERLIRALTEVTRLVPGDLSSAWDLCRVALHAGHLGVALEHANRLIAACPNALGPYRVAARAHAYAANYRSASELLDRASERFPTYEVVKSERREAHDLALGLSVPDSQLLRHRPDNLLPPVPNATQASGPLPEITRLPAFAQDVLKELLEFVVELHRTPPRFMREGSYIEADFRDTASLRLSMRWPHSYSEPVAAQGFVDLIVSTEGRAESLATEFKIWGHNDYLASTEQAIGYASERDQVVAIVMINPCQQDIAPLYVEQVILNHRTYVRGSFRRNPIEPSSSRLVHFASRHGDALGRPVSVFHFVVNAVPPRRRRPPRPRTSASPRAGPAATRSRSKDPQRQRVR